jgi:anhydro-N-acetylmuramic acid kinase
VELLRHPFLRKHPPKTTGREEFGEQFVRHVLARAKGLKLKGKDLVATVTYFTAATIADAYKRYVFPQLALKTSGELQIILGGGGAKNPLLKRMIQERIERPCSFFTHQDFGIDNSAKEPLAFAILAHETLRGRPGNVPSATGAKKAVVLGKIVPGPR